MTPLRALLVTVAVLATPAGLAAQAPPPLRVIVFPGGFNWPIRAAQAQGFFAREGVDIAMTAFDNVVASQEGQGEAEVNVPPDLVVVMGGDHGFLRLVVVPEVRSDADLRGRELAVAALTTGYARRCSRSTGSGPATTGSCAWAACSSAGKPSGSASRRARS